MSDDQNPSSSPSKFYYEEGRDEMANYVPLTTKRLLDVGCAQGKFGTNLLRDNNELEIWGIEPFEDAAKVAQERLTRVINTTVEDSLASLPEGYFDCAVFNDSLEHLADPWVVLGQLKAKLASNATVVASIPNIRYFHVIKQLLQEADFEYAPYGVLDKTHLRFFTKKSMERLFTESGYRVSRVEGIKPASFPWKFGLMNLLCGNSFEDARYERFAVVASPQ
jgi:2-polyprenyl-3-methyl-5-hydroxy-6-metoxy-1,4-benzoquinol methylase